MIIAVNEIPLFKRLDVEANKLTSIDDNFQYTVGHMIIDDAKISMNNIKLEYRIKNLFISLVDKILYLNDGNKMLIINNKNFTCFENISIAGYTIDANKSHLQIHNVIIDQNFSNYYIKSDNNFYKFEKHNHISKRILAIDNITFTVGVNSKSTRNIRC